MEIQMRRTTSLWRPALAVAGLAICAACADRAVAQETYVAPYTVPVAPAYTTTYTTTYAAPAPAPAGTVLTTSNGMTVYVFDRDAPGRSTCYDQCAQYWIPVYAPAGAVAGNGLTLIPRGDGRMQWATSQGLPLYTYYNDRAPGDVTGNNIDGTWHVIAISSGPYYNGGTYTTYPATTAYGYPNSYPTYPTYPNNNFPSDVRTVTADGAAVTIQPGTNSAIVTVVNAGAQVRVLDDDGEWTHVEANGQDGFMRTSALR
jgi:predicted lipoprotein with Yx(FWY)xxD motif